MPNDSGATNHDTPRPAATGRDNNEHTLTIEEVADRYAKAGHPRTIRTLQRYCVSGHLDAETIATTWGDKYLVTPQSVARHIAQIEELRPLDTVATDRDQARPVATPTPPQEPRHAVLLVPTPSYDTERQTATGTGDVSRHVERLEKEVEQTQDELDFYREQAKEERAFYREQLDRKDKTIDSLLERDRETNILVRGLQEMLSPLLGPARRDPPREHPGQG
jgi:hypothetical protein